MLRMIRCLNISPSLYKQKCLGSFPLEQLSGVHGISACEAILDV